MLRVCASVSLDSNHLGFHFASVSNAGSYKIKETPDRIRVVSYKL